MKFEHIFKPILINHMEVKNRMVVSAMVTNYCEENGMPTEKFIAYHERKAKGGWGLVITEDFAVSKTAGAFKRLPALWSQEHVEPYRIFTERIHRCGGRIVAQLYHAGRETCSAITGEQCVAPSPIPDPVVGETPRALSVAEIGEIEEQFAQSALRAKQAGFDGIEVHGAHGYLVGQFLSPYSNKRCDEYGGTLGNRARFALEIVGKIRAVCGKDFPILYRMSAREYVDGGLGIEETKAAARLLEEAGVDCIHVSQGVYASQPHIIPPSVIGYGAYIENAARIREAVSIPVIGAGRINDPAIAESIIATGKADLCTMARASLADPEMPNKAREGRYEEILHCIGCVQGCAGENGKGRKVRCLVNPLTGMEDEYRIVTAVRPKRVVVVGGGVAGCEAAVTAAQRGHQVILLEKSGELGGQWIAASVPVGKGDFASFAGWQRHMLKTLGVDIRLNCDADRKMLQVLRPDTVILATGSVPAMPPIPGLREYAVHAQDLLRGFRQAGRKTVIIGGGLVGAETADYLSENGGDITILEMLPEIVKDGEDNPTYYLKKRLQRKGVKAITSARVTEVGQDFVSYEKNASVFRIEQVETVVAAIGMCADMRLKEELKSCAFPVISIGDCNETAGNGYRAIREGFEAGIHI